MGKKGKRAKGSHAKKTKGLWPIVIAVLVLGVAASLYFLWGGESSAGHPGDHLGELGTNPASSSSSLRNRLVLPAQPQSPRPITLDPYSFPDPEVQQAYQVAREIPEVLERIPCYCGCYGNSGHRNNLDCFKDSHGVT